MQRDDDPLSLGLVAKETPTEFSCTRSTYTVVPINVHREFQIIVTLNYAYTH